MRATYYSRQVQNNENYTSCRTSPSPLYSSLTTNCQNTKKHRPSFERESRTKPHNWSSKYNVSKKGAVPNRPDTIIVMIEEHCAPVSPYIVVMNI